jgi:hypothetical protein
VSNPIFPSCHIVEFHQTVNRYIQNLLYLHIRKTNSCNKYVLCVGRLVEISLCSEPNETLHTFIGRYERYIGLTVTKAILIQLIWF